jgi:ABC-type glycerol-3-phosphate transport system substrate-binding protein
LDLGPYVDDPSFPVEDFFPGTLDRFRWRGGIYGLPATVLPILMLYDPGMFDEVGVPYPRIGWTWDDFMQAVAQLTLREQGEVTRYGFVDTWAYSTVQAMVHQFGVSLWDEHSDPPRRSVAASSVWREGVAEAALPAYLATLEFADTSTFDLRWEIPWLGYAYPWLDEAFQAVVAGYDPQQALVEAQEKARALVTCLDVTEDSSDPDQLLVCARHVDPDYPLAGLDR